YGFPATASAPERACDEARPLRVGFVGTLVWHKGAHVLIEAARLLRGSFELHLHGATGTFPDYSDRLRRDAAGLPVIFHDGFDGDSAAVFAGLDVLVVPSLWPENSPLVIHEAFMHGVPVVGARMGGIPGLVTHDVNGLLYDAFSAPALAECLQRLLDAPGLLTQLASRVPAVKSIEADALEWEARYHRLTHAAEVPA
ncbi:MAG TPA: glycosyltransferase, partial [Vicinamibacterales bacterium]